MRVLLSIRPEHAARILDGEKRFEYRRRVFRQEVTCVVLYASSPMRKLVGEFQLGEVLSDHPDKLWLATAAEGGITYEQFSHYFAGCTNGYALKVDSYTKYAEPVDPEEVFDGFRAPQSFAYIG
ncbi:MAG: hypothetical protein ABFD77_10210 [Thermotogota bacterium]